MEKLQLEMLFAKWEPVFSGFNCLTFVPRDYGSSSVVMDDSNGIFSEL